MALDTYSGLLSALAAFSVRSDQTALWPACVSLAEAQMNRALATPAKPVRPMVGRSDATFDEGFESAPPDLIRPLSLTLYRDAEHTDLVGKLAYTAPENLDAIKAGRVPNSYDLCLTTDGATEPAWYTLKGSEMEFFPVPSSARYGELTYVKRIPALSDDNPSNWLLRDHSDVYMYGALVQFGIMTSDERKGDWVEAYAAALEGVKSAYPTETDKRTLRTDVPRSCRY